MVVEKQMAFAETCVAVQTEMFRMMLAPWTHAERRPPDAGGDRPRRRRVKANVRRLRR